MSAEDLIAEFNQRYRVAADPVMRRAELEVIGCDYGATSFTTRAQADWLARLLRLGPTRSLLDVGSGAGWPGIYLARSTGARVVLTDVPMEGLHTAIGRIETEAVQVVAASGEALPLRDNTFDAATSSDVMC